MKHMTILQAARACHGVLSGTEGISEEYLRTQEASCVVIDSRRMEQGGIFIATRGEHVDGHSFIPQVAKQGALAVICEEKPKDCEAPCIVVEDSFQALKDLAEYYRMELSIPFVGITGSVGKTSTKEFIASVLGQRFQVLKTAKNYNNEIGVPLTILSVREEHQAAVLEMGINQFGEMHRLSKMVHPDICVITNIGQCHLENLGSREGVLRAKSEIFDFMNPRGQVFVNGDDDMLVGLKLKEGERLIHFGMQPANEIYASEVCSRGLRGSTAVLHMEGESFPIEIPLPGEHMILDALAAAGVGKQLGLTSREIQEGIRRAHSVDGRSHVILLKDEVLIDDCYNANPTSVHAALDMLAMAEGRKVAILGDMGELGEETRRLHGEIGSYAVAHGTDVLLCVGELSENMYLEAERACKEKSPEQNNHPELYYFKTRQAMQEKLPAILQKGDTILVKASHSMGFEHIVEQLRQLYEEAPH